MYEKSEKPTRRIAMIAVSLLMVLSLLLAVMLPQQGAGAVGLAVTCSTYHTVASGETLSSISVKYDVSVAEIASANDLKEPYQIFVGQRLCIPGNPVVTTTAEAASTATGPDFTLKEGSDPYTLEIATVGYPAKSPYYVRISRSDSPSLTAKLGTMKTNKSGVAKRTFPIPNKFRTAPLISICLKNAYTDKVQCKSYIP